MDDIFASPKPGIDLEGDAVMYGDRTYRFRTVDFRGEKRIVVRFDHGGVTGVVGGYFATDVEARDAIEKAEQRRKG